jgi:hypothetical protein
MPSGFQVDIIAVSENVLTSETLERAATRLLHSWPLLSFRTNFTVSVIESVQHPHPANPAHSGVVRQKSQPNSSTTAS